MIKKNTKITEGMPEKIKEAREKQNLTQQELADLLGITRETLSNIENGKKPTITLNAAYSMRVILQDYTLFTEKEDAIKIDKKKSYNFSTTDKGLIDVGESFCERLSAARIKKGFTQENLAKEIDISRRTIIRLEAGTHLPTSDTFYALATVLNVTPAWLYGELGEDRLSVKLSKDY